MGKGRVLYLYKYSTQPCQDSAAVQEQEHQTDLGTNNPKIRFHVKKKKQCKHLKEKQWDPGDTFCWEHRKPLYQWS